MLTEHSVAAFNLASTASAVTQTVVAVSTFIAAVVVIVGLARAFAGRRLPQLVIEDVSSIDGTPTAASSGLSPQLRQAIRQALLRTREDASYSVGQTLEKDARSRLLQTHGHIRMKKIAAELRSTTKDSLTTLAAGVRGVAPKQADGLLAALSAALPAQRGWVVQASPAVRGARSDASVGLVLELAPLGHPPDAVTSFWATSSDLQSATTDAARAAGTRDSLNLLFHPAAAWVATRLVSRQLAESNIPVRWRLRSGKFKDEIRGLQMQLAGQLSLDAMRMQKDFDRGFAEQALDDLTESARLLPDYFRPHSTEAAVHERLGRSYQRSGNMQQAATEFTKAIHGYDVSMQALSASVNADAAEHKATHDRIRVRRAKCRLLSGDSVDFPSAQTELAELSGATGSTAPDLYNSACLFAVAMSCTDLSPHDRSQYAQHAWRLLGLALLADDEGTSWTLVKTDNDFAAIDAKQLSRFSAAIKSLHPEPTPLVDGPAQQIVEKAMSMIDLNCSQSPWHPQKKSPCEGTDHPDMPLDAPRLSRG